MTGEEITGPAAPKMVRLLSFMAAGVICTFAINQWRKFESKRVEQNGNELLDSQSISVQK